MVVDCVIIGGVKINEKKSGMVPLLICKLEGIQEWYNIWKGTGLD